MEGVKDMRTQVVPPLPEILTNLDKTPEFFEDPDPVQHSDVFPSFSGLRPLMLRRRGDASVQAAPPQSGDAASGSAPSKPRALRVGVILAGEQSCLPSYPTNVIAGLFRGLKALSPGARLVGFVNGPRGFLEGKFKEITENQVKKDMNQGSWRLLGHGSCRDGSYSKENRMEEAQIAAEVCNELRLDALVIVAGPKDLSWAATLATAFTEEELCRTKVIGVPHSKNLNLYVKRYMPLTLGFDTARRLLSEVAGNIFVDALSSNKYWHFIRCGEDALTVEVALQTRSNFSVLTMGRQAHHISDQKETLMQTVTNICEVVQSRRRSGRHSGVVLISRQLIETLPEMDQLKAEIAAIVKTEAADKNRQPFPTEVDSRLKSDATKALFKRLPRFVQMNMIRSRDASGLPILPKDLEAERILGRFVQQELRLKPPIKKVKATFAPRFHAMDLMTSSPLPQSEHCVRCQLGLANFEVASTHFSTGMRGMLAA
ncbi:PFP-BETA1 [Symbiodinium natans]|uniref:PFP-BETA1 protein n=1 Tax=Symbiodinium natans TaxID=878477 RepID=A0A812GM77_9DINO|nr:PFP-BETA1 [Symbiodinium natans]